MSLNNEPRMDRNYWLALALSMLVITGYWAYLHKAYTPYSAQQMAQVKSPPPATPPSEQAAPPPAEQALNPAEGPFLQPAKAPAVTVYSNGIYEAEFSTLAGTLTRLVYTGEEKISGIRSTVFYETPPTEPGIFGIRFGNEEADLSKTIFQMNRSGEKNQNFEFVYEKPGEYRLSKRYYLGTEDPVIALEIGLENLSARERHFPLEFLWGLEVKTLQPADSASTQALVRADKIREAGTDKLSKKGFEYSVAFQWAGVIKKYFALLVKPDWNAIHFEARQKGDVVFASMKMEPVTLAPGAVAQKEFFIYAGPQRYEVLNKFGFGELHSRGFFGYFKIAMLLALKFFDRYCHNFGWAIILLTLVIKGVFTPLTHMSLESMRKMQELQPKIRSLQEHYKKDPSKLNQKIMELYKKHKVNPMMGCLPMLLQIPIFIAFYQVLSEAIELKGAPFVGWIQDLAEPDVLFAFPFSIPFLGSGFHLLPLLMLASMILQQKLTPQMGSTPEQTKMMAWMMPAVFGFLFYKMPSGLVLYWFVNNLLSILHQVFVKRMAVALHLEDSE